MNRRPKLDLIAPSADAEEAAAIVAALERFMRDTAPVLAPPSPAPTRWQTMARHEAIDRQPDLPAPWA
jgi:hypothetical protein